MSSKMLNTTEGFLSNPKRIISLAILIAVFVILFFIFKGQIKNLIHNVANNVENNRALDEEIKNTGTSPSFSDTQFKTYATRLYNAMKGAGTDEATVFAVFNDMQNTADVLKLISIYGMKDNEDLTQWLRGDLSSGEIKKLNSILSGKGIAYQF